MEIKQSWHDAIFTRTSRRAYTGTPLTTSQVDSIESLIATINQESSLHFQFIENADKIFAGFKASYGMLKGVTSAIALVGDKNMENIQSFMGYYGEFLVLQCVALNLGTCWIGGTYDKKAARRIISLQDSEKIFAIISIGHVNTEKNLKEKLISTIGKNKQTFDQLLQSKDEPVPSWVSGGIQAARLAPSAMNKKPIEYSYIDKTLTAYITKPNHSFKEMDLGISLAHFEIGAWSEGVTGKWVFHQPTNQFTFEVNK